MKKLMIAASVVMLGIAANAAVSLTWTGSWILDQAGKDLAAGTATYLVDANLYTTLLQDVEAGTFDTSAAGIMSTTEIIDGKSSYGARINVSEPSIDSSKWITDQTVALYSVFVTDDYIGITQNTASGKTIPADNNALKATFGELSSEKGDSYVDWYKVQTVPEPTSGLLLLLGVAGLALKRRRA